MAVLVLRISPEEVTAYMGHSGASYSPAQAEDALRAEQVAQARVCKTPQDPHAELDADLREALLRRVVRNLAMRSVPLGVQSDDMGAVRIGSTDPEIRRLEGPFRKRVAA